MTTATIRGGRVLCDDGIRSMALGVAEGRLLEAPPAAPMREIDADGLLVLPGIVDVHGDAFERQIMPRPGVRFPLDLALLDTDAQMIANGITTAFHGVTVSWEPGLRSLDTARALLGALATLRPRLRCDTRAHLRWETFALDARDDVSAWLAETPRPILAFNDHTTRDHAQRDRPQKLAKMAARAGLAVEAYVALLDAAWARRDEVPAAIERLAAEARAQGCVLLAHDERSPEERAHFRALGAVASEFPMTEPTARAAREAGEHTVMGAPNVVRGGSHTGALDATQAIRQDLCSTLASDYFYPAPLQSAFKLVGDNVLDLPAAWRLVSTNPAELAGLEDRGRLAPGLRADLILVNDHDPRLPRVAAAFVEGRQVYAG